MPDPLLPGAPASPGAPQGAQPAASGAAPQPPQPPAGEAGKAGAPAPGASTPEDDFSKGMPPGVKTRFDEVNKKRKEAEERLAEFQEKSTREKQFADLLDQDPHLRQLVWDRVQQYDRYGKQAFHMPLPTETPGQPSPQLPTFPQTPPNAPGGDWFAIQHRLEAVESRSREMALRWEMGTLAAREKLADEELAEVYRIASERELSVEEAYRLWPGRDAKVIARAQAALAPGQGAPPPGAGPSIAPPAPAGPDAEDPNKEIIAFYDKEYLPYVPPSP